MHAAACMTDWDCLGCSFARSLGKSPRCTHPYAPRPLRSLCVTASYTQAPAAAVAARAGAAAVVAGGTLGGLSPPVAAEARGEDSGVTAAQGPRGGHEEDDGGGEGDEGPPSDNDDDGDDDDNGEGSGPPQPSYQLRPQLQVRGHVHLGGWGTLFSFSPHSPPPFTSGQLV